MQQPSAASRFGIDPKTKQLMLGRWRLGLPQSRGARIGLGIGLLFGGVLGFLPILGFWMIPLGFVVLSHDVAFVRRRRRRIVIWWGRRKRPSRR